MHTRKRMILASVLACLLVVLGVAWYYTAANVTEESFTFEVVDPETTMKAGEPALFTVRLNNLTNWDLVLEHGAPLISLFLVPDGEAAQTGIVGASLMQTTLKAHQYAEEEFQIDASEAGNYVLVAFCAFEINGKQYRYECDDILISVTA